MKPKKLSTSVTSLGLRVVFAMVVALLGDVATAQAVRLSPDGTGLGGSVATWPGLAAHGSGFVVALPNALDPTHSTFYETGAYQLTQADGVSPLGSRDLTLTYSVAGTVNLFTGEASFSSGVIHLYSDATFNFGSASADPSVMFGANDGTRIASFLVMPGGGVSNGTAHIQAGAIPGSVLPGYFVSDGGQDLNEGHGLQFSVDISNGVNLAPSATVVSELVCKSGFTGPGCNGSPYANTPYYFVVTDGANAVLSAVPEPASGALALAGVAMLLLVSRVARRQ